MDFSQINFLAVLVAAVASFILGAIWYSAIFGKAWQKELGFTDEYLQEANMAVIFGTSFVLMLIMSFGISMLISHAGATIDVTQGAMHGFLIGIMFVGMSMGINYLYQRRSIKLWLIDAGYQITFLTIQGAIIGAWH
ncbi:MULTISPECIES: DUF1761 domain-containing protein [Flammeovirga]|uniref:DUF1761 domain-containing protein n=1 Tax=Flammeovirga agarivorans TaxID=2726742 RepID=A0A7X8SL03_9BACT|nr:MULTISPECIES: DUF1761 domain-containing protein [Flammeovirga]NLR92159.1 DUF1761 domain-containing protein [Flammeovirga agarivorans]